MEKIRNESVAGKSVGGSMDRFDDFQVICWKIWIVLFQHLRPAKYQQW